MSEAIRVGIGVLVWKDGQILLGKRLGEHRAGEYASPGGHMEFGESFAECAAREVREECGLEIKNIRFLFVANLRTAPDRQYVHLNVEADWVSGEPTVCEPDKCEGWGWYRVDALPEPMFPSYKYFAEYLRTGKMFFDLL